MIGQLASTESEILRHTIKWQIGLTGRGDIYELHVSIDSCGPKREWLVVKAKPALGKAPKKQRKK